jgi:hypothetical protein
MSSQPEPILDPDDDEIAWVRAIRHRISARFGHDPYRLVAYYMERQDKLQERLVRAADSQSEA